MDTITSWLTVGRLACIAGLALLLYMTLWYLLAHAKRRLDVVDTAWGGSFIVIAWLAVAVHAAPVTVLAAVLVTLWGGRLMKHTWRRHGRHDSDDPRYTKLSAGWKRAFWLQVFGKIFVLQGVLALLIGLPIILNVRGQDISVLPVLGALLWAIGFWFESRADHQLQNFKDQTSNKKVLDTGLWRYSRHPNYFGESVQWFGIAVIAAAAPWGWLGLLGPLLLTFLLVFVSGIPTVEKGKHKDPDYWAYQRRTSSFVPLPPRK